MAKSKDTYRIIGVDPGTQVLGFSILECVSNKVQLLEMGVVHLELLSTQNDKLKRIFDRIQQLIKIHQPNEMAIEAPFYGKNAQAMLKLGRAQGVAMVAAITLGLEVTEYAPRKIKQAVTGNGNASKEQVAAMVKQILSFEITSTYLDATDAVGVALCHHYQKSRPSLGKKKSGWDSFLKNNPDRII